MTRDQVESCTNMGAAFAPMFLPSTETWGQAQSRMVLKQFAFNDTPPVLVDIISSERERGFGFGFGHR